MEEVTGQQLIDMAVKFKGTPYIFGAEVKKENPNPKAFDCSEFVEYVCAQFGVKMPDGSQNQFNYCKGRPMTLMSAKTIAGALVFRYDKVQKRIVHVGFSDGKGNTVEARGKDYGTNVFAWRASWTHAALIPGVVYPPPGTK